MSIIAIRAALEVRLNAITPALATAWENNPFNAPAASVPYQAAWVLFATPDNREAGAHYQEIGYMQVSLKYPLGAGSAAANARAILVRDAFKKGTSLVSGGITTVVDRTPAIGSGVVEADRWSLTVKIPFHAHIN